MSFFVKLKRIVIGSVVLATAGIVAIVFAARHADEPHEVVFPRVEPFRLSTLDILPSEAGGLRIKHAWRVDSTVGIAQNIGVYRWEDGSLPDVTITCATCTNCSTPIDQEPTCDRDLPRKLTLGAVKGCGFSGYDRDTGPIVQWRGCDARFPPAPRAKSAFDALRVAATDAAKWSERYRKAEITGDTTGFSINRDVGLLSASRAGHPDVPSLRGQLD